MKPYKLKRREEAHRKKNPTKAKRNQELMRVTKQIALDEFERMESGTYWRYPRFESGSSAELNDFGYEFYHKLRDRVNIQYADLGAMFPLYIRCMKTLKDNQRKAVFMEKTYKPLAEDLFEIQ